MRHRRSLSRFGSWIVGSAATAAFVMIAGCGPVSLVANTNIPPPLVVKMPVVVALFVPSEFSGYVHKEERWSTDWQIELGKAQTDGITGLMNAMFEHVVPVDSVNAGAQVAGVQAILEPSIEEYAFVTPRDAGSPFYAVSIKYRVNVYMPDGKLADSWGFTGYGTAPSQGLSSEAPLSTATGLAMRDAGAKLAVEFREQQVVRSLLPESQTADSPPAPAAAPATPPTEGSGSTPPAAPPGDDTVKEESEKEPEAKKKEEGGSTAPPKTQSAPAPKLEVEKDDKKKTKPPAEALA